MRAARILFLAPIMTGLGLTSANTTWAADPPPTAEVVATIPSAAFNEGITQDTDGTIYVTGMLESNLWKIGTDGKISNFSGVDPYAVILGVAAVEEGIVVGAFRNDFRTPKGYDFSDAGPAVVLLDRASGKILAEAQGQNGQLFNGMTADGRGGVLVVDSLSASVWRFDPKTHTLTQWIKDDLLEPTEPSARGANGIKVAGDHVYIANSSKRSIFRVGIDANGKAQGPVTLAVENLPHVDDFAIAADGTIFLPPTSQAATGPMIRVAPDGAQSTHAVGPPGATAIVSRDGNWVYWPSNNGLAPKTTDPQKLVRVPAR